MRKITGYIGALIIVFALMGSILMGYALNVNGNSTIANEYDYITDVSGLYSHSQEPNYIDYNPASNYIGYSNNPVYQNTGIGYNELKAGETVDINLSGGQITIEYGEKTYNIANQLFCASGQFYIYCFENRIGLRTAYNEYLDITSASITMDENGDIFSLTYNGGNYRAMGSSFKPVFYYPYDDGDYVQWDGGPVYHNNDTQLRYVVELTPAYSGNIVSVGSSGWDGDLRGIPNGTIINHMFFVSYTDPVIFNEYGIKRSTITYTQNLVIEGASYSAYLPTANLLISKNVNGNGTGINYTDSNRVNNYPIEMEYDDTRTVINTSVNLLAVSSADYMTNKPALIASQSFDNSDVYSYLTYQATMYKVNSYKLSDIFSTLTIPVNTNSVRIDAPTTTAQYGYWWNGASGSDVMYFTGLTDNWVVLAPFGNVAQGEIVDFDGMANQYIVYYPGSGKCDLYNADGVKLGTYGGLDQLYVIFADPTGANEVKIDFKYRGNNRINTDYDYWTATKTNPFINLTYNTGGEITTTHYADITKGYSIKASNTVNTVWDNQYLNGNIQLLFRADDTLAIYSNDIIVGDNTISIDYNTNRFYVQLNGADPVDIGTWRNILLNIDLRNGELSAIPVRTFNSYTNVVLDNTSIFIGELVNSAPTNIIEWAPTTNSLTFNVYSTSVFMDTYGVVMVNPTLNITDYFTDLNNFYRLRLFNFSVLGSTITINGVTYDVTNDTITINEQTIQVKNMAITYADGHAYISDSNADIDLGEITDNNVSMAGAWYFETDLYRGYTTQKMVYEWNWGDFILNNTQFCIMYMGLALVGLIVARHYCNMSITDYIVLILSFVIALTVQVVA